MDREIKFKFVIDGKHLSNPYTLDELIEISEEKIFEDMEVCTCSLNESNNHCEGDCIRFDNSEITDKIQYTGLKDKNGVDIYEGDIVTDNKSKFHIEYNTQNSGFWLMPSDLMISMSVVSNPLGNGYLKRRDLEIVGNIYETPELLK